MRGKMTMSSEDEKKQFLDFMAVAGLFLLTPIGYLLILYVLYKLISNGENITTYPPASKFGLLLMFILPPLEHWICYKYCQDNFGWFKKKK